MLSLLSFCILGISVGSIFPNFVFRFCCSFFFFFQLSVLIDCVLCADGKKKTDCVFDNLVFFVLFAIAMVVCVFRLVKWDE